TTPSSEKPLHRKTKLVCRKTGPAARQRRQKRSSFERRLECDPGGVDRIAYPRQQKTTAPPPQKRFRDRSHRRKHAKLALPVVSQTESTRRGAGKQPADASVRHSWRASQRITWIPVRSR